MRILPLLLIFAFVSAHGAECTKCDDVFYGRNGAEQNYETALSLYLADSENPDSLNIAGYMFRLGLGTDKNEEKALQYYRKAAEAGDRYGMYNLAGILKSSDPATAFSWMLAAAKKGLPRAMNDLGCMLDKGDGTQINPAEAFRWFRVAAEAGDKYAQHNLALMYKDGRGTEQSAALSDLWEKKAQAQGLFIFTRPDEKPKSPPASKVSPDNLITVDKTTGLAWQDTKDAATKEMTWAEADKYCRELNLNGVIGWHMPDIKELLTIVDKTKSPAAKPVFKNRSTEVFWSATSNPNDKASARVVYMFDGFDYWLAKKYLNRVRCVRNK